MAFGFEKKRDGKIGSASVKDVVGAILNAPNTVVGMTYGSLGQAAGAIAHRTGLQGRQLGPLYLPSNVAGGLTALMLDRDDRGRPDWHGPHNWNERGPQAAPARPWAPRAQR